jgi:hypothetical protein
VPLVADTATDPKLCDVLESVAVWPLARGTIANRIAAANNIGYTRVWMRESWCFIQISCELALVTKLNI